MVLVFLKKFRWGKEGKLRLTNILASWEKQLSGVLSSMFVESLEEATWLLPAAGESWCQEGRGERK